MFWFVNTVTGNCSIVPVYISCRDGNNWSDLMEEKKLFFHIHIDASVFEVYMKKILNEQKQVLLSLLKHGEWEKGCLLNQLGVGAYYSVRIYSTRKYGITSNW